MFYSDNEYVSSQQVTLLTRLHACLAEDIDWHWKQLCMLL